jgi:Major Facilitator Superfamily
MLFTEPVVFFFSLWVSFSWAVLYLFFSSIPLVFTTNHSFTISESGAVFSAISIGAIIATLSCLWATSLLQKYYPEHMATPEGRLYYACFASVCMPIGMFWFGWTSYSSIHWISPTIALAVATIGIYSIYLATFNYLADSYHLYASSALAAQSFCRNMLGGIFPLLTVQMYTKMGFAGASSFLGGVAALLTVVPWVLLFYGPRIRKRSPFASQIMKAGDETN